MRCSSCHLVGLGHVVGVLADRAHRALRAAGERDGAGAAATLAGRGSGRLGRGEQPGLAEVGGVGETGGVALDHPDAGAPVATAGDLLDPAVVEPRRGGALVLGVHLGEVGARAHRRRQHPFQHVAVDHAAQPTEPTSSPSTGNRA